MYDKLLNRLLAWKAQKKEPEHLRVRQWKVLKKLLSLSNKSEFGRKYNFDSITSIEEYQKRVPVMHIEDLNPYWKREAAGEKQVILNSTPPYFAVSSGTTGEKKLIAVTNHEMKEIRKCEQRLIGLEMVRNPYHNFFNRKLLFICSRSETEKTVSGASVGMISGIMHNTTPKIFQNITIPSKETANIEDRREKLRQTAVEVRGQSVGAITGIPTSIIDTLAYLKEQFSAKEYEEFCSTVEIIICSGINYRPYRNRFISLLGKTPVFLDIYVSSEGIYGCESLDNSDEMELFYDTTFFEFIPYEDYQKEMYDQRLLIDEITVGEKYVMAVATGNGTFSYVLGDVVECTHKNPVRIKIAGRAQLTLNIASEKTSITMVEKVIELFVESYGVSVGEFFLTEDFGSSKPSYHWYFEERVDLKNISEEEIVGALERLLAEANPLYHYFKNEIYTMGEAKLTFVKSENFEQWFRLKESDPLHHKVPHIITDEKVVNSIIM